MYVSAEAGRRIQMGDLSHNALPTRPGVETYCLTKDWAQTSLSLIKGTVQLSNPVFNTGR